jgi:phosphoserine phosphatase RsbU/P
VIGTDGIWESVDRNGTPYGMERFCTVIRENARSEAQDILDAVYADIKAFTLGARQEDDITLVVAKLKDGGEPATDWAI